MPTNTLFLRFPNGRPKALTFSYDDSVREDIRLVSIFRENGLAATFNINSALYANEGDFEVSEKKIGFRMTRAEATALYTQDGIEPALHAFTHPYLETLPKAQVAYEILKDREALEKQFGRITRGMAYPYGTFSDDVVRVLEDCGIAYCRITKASHHFKLPTDWLRLAPTCHHKDPMLDDLTEKFLQAAPTASEQPLLFYIWGHAYEFARENNWELIESLAKKLANHEDVWYATNIEIYEYVEAFRSLVLSLDMTKVYNPTAKTVWFCFQKKLYRVAAGETVTLENQFEA